MKKLLVGLLCLGLMGCATGYQKRGFTGGYKETKIQDDIFKVDFAANAYSSRGRTQDFCLLRCAELALENDYQYFIIIDADSSTKTGVYTTPTTATSQGSCASCSGTPPAASRGRIP